MKKALLATTAIVSLLAVSSCGKYEEGPGVSLLTKKARLTGIWDLKETIDENVSYTDNNDATVEYTKSNSLIYTDGSVSVTGTWDFDSAKEKLSETINLFGSNTTDTRIILRLTNSELWLKDTDDNYIYKYEKQ